jgi:thioester reductase-like protein
MTTAQATAGPAGDQAGQFRFPLSYPQLRLWFLEQLAPGDPAYHMPVALRLRGPLDVGALDRAFQAIVDRHEVLRTAFAATAGEPEQVVGERLAVTTVLADFSGLADISRRDDDPGLDGSAGWGARAAGEVVRLPFDLSAAPLLRILLARLGPLEHTLIVAVHHMACDGWSVGVLAAELSELYAAALAGREPVLPELPVQYGDFAVWQREFLAGQRLDAVLAHWEQALAGAPRALDLPTDRSRLLTTGTRAAHARRTMAPESAAGLDRAAGEHGASRFMAVLAAYGIALARAADTTDLVIGTPVAGRSRPEVRPLIGCFIDMLPLRIDLSGDPAAPEVLDRVRRACLAAFAHQELPFERLVEHLRPERDLPRSPLFQAMLTFQDTPEGALDLPGLTIDRPGYEQAAAKYELTLNVEQPDGGLLLDLEYNRDLFDPATADRLLDGVTAALDWLVAADGVPLSGAPGLPAPAVRPGDHVSIRGYRTGPEEMRRCLIQHPLVQDCAVVVRDGSFAAYVKAAETAVQDVPGGLAGVLRAELPEYLVPGALTELDRIPRAPDGTVDLSALPEPAAAVPLPARSVPIEPADARETLILDAFRRALRQPALGMADGFFEHGGSSLKAVRLVAGLEHDLGIALPMRRFFRAPTPHGVAAALREESPAGPGAVPGQDALLAADILPAPPHPRAWNPGHVLVTGATGFLGHALLERLLCEPGLVVTCLVRADDDAQAAARLLWTAQRARSAVRPGGRLRVVAGDLARPRLGLPEPRYRELTRDVAAVYHCAAEVSFAAPYAALRAANVTGTEEVIRFAATDTGKALHYLSTLGQGGADGAMLREELQPVSAPATTGYVASKRVAETLVAQAAQRGLPTTILRPGLVTAHGASGAMGEHDQLALGLRAALRTGVLPDLPDLPVHIMPADEAAEAVVALTRRPAAAGRVIHLHNPRRARLGEVAELLEGLGHPVAWIPVPQWARTLADSDLPPAALLLVRLFAEAPDRPAQSIETAAAAALLGRPPAFSGLSAAYLQRAVTFVLTSSDDGGSP